MHKKNMYKAIVAIAVAMAFVMPVAAFANVGTIGVTSNIENANDIENIVETSTNSDTSDNYNAIPLGKTIYVDDSGGADYTTIQEAIDNATTGDAIYVYNGFYCEDVIVDKELKLAGESRENVIVNGSGTGNVVYVTVDNVSIDTFTITNGSYGIKLSSSSNIIANCDVYGNTQDGIRLSSNNDIINCNVYNNGVMGIVLGTSVVKSEDNNIINCNAYNNLYGIDVMNSLNNNIVNCDIYGNSYYGLSLVFCYDGGIIVTNCDIYDNGNGVYIANSIDCKLTGNTIYDNNRNFAVTGPYADCFRHDIDPSNTVDGRPIYYLVDQENITLDETKNFGYLGLISCKNITAKNSDVCGIVVVDTTDSTISNVTVHHAWNGIVLSKSSNNNIINCTVYHILAYGIKLDGYCLHNDIIDCNVYDSMYGIYILYDSDYNNIVNCSVYDNTKAGITIDDSKHNNIMNCNAYNNAHSGDYGGIWITAHASYNNIVNCNVYNNNKYGIYLSMLIMDGNNLIHHNNVVDNTQNAKLYFGMMPNTWDNGYPSGGNYWSDYNGVDEYSGPGQDIPGSDGIGDTPYSIPGGSEKDRYPLMMILDDTPPVITDVTATPDVQNTTEPVNITFMVTDNWDLIDTVKLHIDGPEGFTLDVTMNEGSYWYEDTYTTMGIYYYSIWANDTNGNIATSDTCSFVITDLNDPISAVDPLPTWETVLPFIVTATAYDNTEVANVTLYYRYSEDGTDWTDWTFYGTDEEENPWSWEFTGSDGYYEFYSIAIDDYENAEDPPSTADTSTGIDTVPPVTTIELSGTMGDNGWYTSSVRVNLSAIDDTSGIESIWYRLDYGYATIYTEEFIVSIDGEHTIEYYSLDNAGNREDAKFADVKIDKTPPVTTHEFDGFIGKDGWFVTPVKVTLSAADATSKVDYTMYKLNDDTSTVYTEPFNVTEDGIHTLCYYSVDLAGNTEPTNVAAFKIVCDIVPPVTTHELEGVMGDNDWYKSNVAVELTAEDDSAGVDYTMYKLDDDVEEEYISSFLVTEEGEHTIVYYSVDNVENREANKSVTFKIDKTAPTIVLTVEKTGFKKWLLTANVSDETSGIAKVEFYLDGELLGEVTTAPYELECTKKGMAQAIVYDNAGNDAISEEAPVSVSQSQSQSSSSSVPLQILSWLFGLR